MPQSSALPTYSAVYAFGDSLSDAGNVSVLTSATSIEPVSPPYASEQYGSGSGSVFSNGPTWVQDLSVTLGLGTLAPSLLGGTDFAYGGAETGMTPQNSGSPQVALLSLPAQLQQFQAKVSSPSASALYTVSIGANDLFDILSATGLTPQQQTTDVNDAVANEISFVTSLVGDGAKNLLVMDVPDIGKTPTYSQGAQAAEATGLASAYDTALNSQLSSLASKDQVSISVINAFQLIDQAVANPADYGLSNVTAPVWSGNFTSASSGTLVSSDPATQDHYLFFDSVHPTETGHQGLAALAQQQLGSGVVELPPGAQSYAAAAGAVVIAGSGSDTVSAAAGQVTVTGGAGMLTFVGGTGASSVTGGTGSVIVFGGAGGGTYGGGVAGPNILVSEGAAGANTTLTGAAAGDRIFGSAAGRDLLVASVGRESIQGGGGSTTIDGGATAASVIFGGSGPTTVNGGAAGADTIVAGSGTTSVAANGDAVFGTTGALDVTGSTGKPDSIIGGAGALSVNGRGGNMLVVAATSSSTINTGNGASLIFANAGMTSVTGGTGSLQVLLGAGSTTVTEGAGAALFDVVSGAAGGMDVINGFRPGTDQLHLFGYMAADVQITSSSGSTLVSLADGTRINLIGVADPGGSIS